MATERSTRRTTTVTIHLSTHDPDDEIGTDDGNDDDDAYASCRVTHPSPRGGTGATLAPEVTDLDALGVFNAEGGVVFIRNHIRITLERFGTLPDGRILLTVADAAALPELSPRPGDEGA